MSTDTLGNPGNGADGSGLVIAKAFNLPDLTMGMAEPPAGDHHLHLVGVHRIERLAG